MSALLMDIGGVVHVDAETEFAGQRLTMRAFLWASAVLQNATLRVPRAGDRPAI